MAPPKPEPIGRGSKSTGAPTKKAKEKATKGRTASISVSKTASLEVRLDCQRKNVPGVRLIAVTPEKNAQIIGGYLHFDSVTELRAFMASEGLSTLVVLVR